MRAESGSISIGGSVSNSTIGVPYEKLEEAVRSRTKDLSDLSESQTETIALLKEKLDLNQRQVQAALATVGEANVPPERLASKLVEIAEKFKELQTAAAAQPGDDARIAALKAQAQTAIADGRLGEADDLLAAIEKIQSEALDRLALNAAQTSSQRGDVALAQLRYRDAARRFEEAAAKLPEGHGDERWQYLQKEEDALLRQGDEFGDNSALLDAIEVSHRCLTLAPRATNPRQWARTEMRLGNVLKVLGERESGPARLEEAVAAYRDALTENTRAIVPLDWAMTENNLGNALERLGERETGTARLEEAVAAYRDALTENTRERVPLDWAMTENNLGLALKRLSERGSPTVRPEEAIEAFRAALEERTRERAPLDWAATENNLGVALTGLALAQNDPSLLQQALAAHRAAMGELTRARDPLAWAMIQNNIGTILLTIGMQEGGSNRLEEAVGAYSEALKERTPDRVPLDWAVSSGGQGLALLLIALRANDESAAKAAVEQIRNAAKTLREGGHAPLASGFEAALQFYASHVEPGSGR